MDFKERAFTNTGWQTARGVRFSILECVYVAYSAAKIEFLYRYLQSFVAIFAGAGRTNGGKSAFTPPNTNEAAQLLAQPHLGQEHNNLVFYLTRCKGTGFCKPPQYPNMGILSASVPPSLANCKRTFRSLISYPPFLPSENSK